VQPLSLSLVFAETRSGLASRITLFCLLSVGWNGYVFGQADHGIHLVFVDQILRPDRWTGDFLEQAAAHHPSLIWWLEAASSSVLGMPLAFALLHGLTLASTAAAIELLVRSLNGTSHAAVATLLVLAPAQFALGGVATLDPLFLPRGAALPLELLALAWAIKGRWPAAFGLLGLAACLHAPSAAGLAIACCVALIGSGRLKASAHLLSPSAFFLGATPVLILWATGTSDGSIAARVDPTWMELIDLRLGHHINPRSWPLIEWIQMAGWMTLGALAARAAACPPEGLRRVRLLLLGLILWALVGGTILARGGRLALLLQLEPWECFRFVTILASCAVGLWASRVPARGLVGVLAASMLLSYVTLGHSPRWQPTGPHDSSTEFIEKIANELPPESFIAWPPGGLESVRWKAGIPGTPTWKDGGEALFNRGLAMRWLESMRTLCGCNPLSVGANNQEVGQAGLADLRRELRHGWENQTAAELAQAATTLGATHYILGRGTVHDPKLEAEETNAPNILIEFEGWVLVGLDPGI